MKIRIYLSKQGFDIKPSNSAGMIKMINSYNLVDIEVENLYKKLINGHFIHNECGYSASSTGSNYYTFKKSLLKQTQVMCVDLDYKIKDTKKDKNGNEIEIIKDYKHNEMPDWDNELLSNLKYYNNNGQEIDVTPTFWMESFSARKITDNKIVGNSIHLFYVFYDPIYNAKDFEKIAISIIYALYRALEVKGYEIPLEKEKCPFDPVGTDMFQGLWGSFNKKHNYNGNLYFPDVWKNAYDDKLKSIIFQKSNEESVEITDEEIKRTIKAYSTVKTIDDIDISKSQYLKYKSYFGHEEGFHIMSVLKHEYSKIEEQVNNKQSLCYQVCKKLLLGNCNDFFDNDENNFYHEYKRCKMYIKRGTDQAAYMSHVIKLIGDTGAIPLIEYKKSDEILGNEIKLNKNEYLSDKKNEILNRFVNDDKTINFLIAEPGLGKTVFAKSLEGNILVIELFNSIILSEEKFPSSEFKKFYGSNYINRESIDRLNVCSANKFVSWCESGEYSNDVMCIKNECMFDYIILDESHLLCLSNYRYDIMGKTAMYLKYIKSLFPEVTVLLMTGTPFGESVLFNNLNTIKIITEPRFKRYFHMIRTSSISGYMMELIKESLRKGLRIFIPADSENWFNTFIDSCVNEGIINKEQSYYFNQPKNKEETEINILNTKLIGDILILGTSSYMSVGIDLEDWKTEFVTIIPTGASMCGNFSGLETLQFANRHRKQNLNVYYVISNNENNLIKPILSTSYRALLNIKNDLLISLYRTNPIIIHIPKYLNANDNEMLEVNEDMFNVFVYYKDMKPIISHPMIIYEYMEKMGWECEIKEINNVHRGIDKEETKKHRDIEKQKGVEEFVNFIEEWANCNYPIINVENTVANEFKMTKNMNKHSLFDVDSIDVVFSNYYAKNTLFNMLLNLREYLTGKGTYNLIMDAYCNSKINISFINRHLKAIKIVNNYYKTGLWQEISDKLSEFYNSYSTIENAVCKNNKKEFEYKRDKMIQNIWDKLSEKIDDENLLMAFNSNYENITDTMIDDFREGIKLIYTMYLTVESKQKKIDKKNIRLTMYKWDENTLSKYEIRKTK